MKRKAGLPSRFLFMTFDFPPSVGGIETRTMNYAKELVRRGDDLIIVHLLNPADRRRLIGSNSMSVGTFNGARLIRYAYSFPRTPITLLSSVLASHFSDREVVHVFTGANTLIGLGYLILARLTRKRAGVSVFGKDFLASRPSKLFFIPLILSLMVAEKVMVNSRSTLERLPPQFRKKATILYPGVDPTVLKTGQGAVGGDRDQRILFVGRLVRRKGLVELLNAFEIVASSHPQSKLVIVGDGPFREEFEQMVAHSPVAPSIELKGMLTGVPLFREYSTCDVFVMPSFTTSVDTEGFGMVFLEAGFFAKPSVGTLSGGIPEAVVDGRTGLLVRQRDVAALAEKISLILDSPELGKSLGTNARERVLAEFTWEQATNRFLRMYSTTAEG